MYPKSLLRPFALVVLLLPTLFLAANASLGQGAGPAIAPDQTTLTLYADADATTKSWEPDTNFGADTMLQVHYDNIEGPAAAFSLSTSICPASPPMP
jgi:hypothetical protein